MFTTPKVHSVSHTRFTRRSATLAPPSRDVLEPRGCRDVVPALTRCGPLQRRPPGLGSERTHRRAALRRKAVQRCHHIVAEVRATLELYMSELEGTRARWQSDRVSNVRKTIRQTRRDSITGTTASTLGSADLRLLPYASSLVLSDATRVCFVKMLALRCCLTMLSLLPCTRSRMRPRILRQI